MTEFFVVKTTIDNSSEADKLANDIITNKLGACVQVSEIKSVYKWNDKVENSKEFLLSIKTNSKKIEVLKDFISQNHSYEIPEIIVTPIVGGSEKYLNWMNEELK